MPIVGVRELKNRLTHYLRLIRQGEAIIITDRGKPIAVLKPIEESEGQRGWEERLAVLACGPISAT